MKHVALFVFLLVFVGKTSAETFVFGESYRTIKSKKSFQTNVLWAQQSLGKRLGVFGWGQVGKTYQQTYGGLYVKPVSWFQVGAATGQEERSKTPRLGSFVFANKSKYFLFGIYENFGATGYWYLVFTDYSVSKRWSVGSHSQAFVGHGARAELRLGKIGPIVPSIRPAILWSRESGARPNVILGLRFTYFKE